MVRSGIALTTHHIGISCSRVDAYSASDRLTVQLDISFGHQMRVLTTIFVSFRRGWVERKSIAA